MKTSALIIAAALAGLGTTVESHRRPAPRSPRSAAEQEDAMRAAADKRARKAARRLKERTS